MMTTGARGMLPVAAAAMVTAGCATNGLASLPLPAPGLGSGGYSLTAVFSNALNLPMNAKVKLAGADVGQLESMVARNYTAVTRCASGTACYCRGAAPPNCAPPHRWATCSSRSSHRPTIPRTTPLLRNGDTIGLDSTAAAATVESVLSSAAILVNGGAVRNFTNIINGFGKATGDQGQAFGDMIRKSNELLGTLDARSDQISHALTQLSRLADQLDAKNQTISDLMTAASPATSALADNTSQLSNLAVQVGDTSRLLARFPSIGGHRHQRPQRHPRPEHDRRGRQRRCDEPGYQLAVDQPADPRIGQIDGGELDFGECGRGQDHARVAARYRIPR